MSVLAENFLRLDNTTGAPPMSWTAEGSGLVKDALLLGGRLRLRIHGESMLPTLWPGDVVEIESCAPEDVHHGEIVLALRDGRLFLHRLVSPCTPIGFQLRGDSMPGPDPWFSPEALLGRLVNTEGNRKLSAGVLYRAAGMVFCHFGAARSLALKLHRRQRISASESQNSEITTELAIGG